MCTPRGQGQGVWVRRVLTDSNEAHNFFVLHITETLELTFECKIQWRWMER